MTNATEATEPPKPASVRVIIPMPPAKVTPEEADAFLTEARQRIETATAHLEPGVSFYVAREDRRKGGHYTNVGQAIVEIFTDLHDLACPVRLARAKASPH